MGVVRSCYSTQARFYPGLPLSTIRYYFCDPDNPFFMGENCFYPWKEYKQFYNLDGVGEITELPRPWYKGRDLNNLDGTVIQGPVGQFAGRGTYNPLAPATCDAHIFNCVDMLAAPDDLFLVITADMVTSGHTSFSVGQVIPLTRLPTQPLQWASDWIELVPEVCAVQFVMLCVANQLLLGFTSNSTQIPADSQQTDPVLAEWADVPLASILGCPDNGEVISCKIIE